MKINLVSQIFLFSFIIVVIRLLIGLLHLNIQFFVDFVLFLSFALTTYLNYKKSKVQNCIAFFFTIGIIQIICSVALFEIAKLIVYSPDFSRIYFYKRVIVFIYILILGFVANGLTLIVFCKQLRKSVNSKFDDNVIDLF